MGLGWSMKGPEGPIGVGFIKYHEHDTATYRSLLLLVRTHFGYYKPWLLLWTCLMVSVGWLLNLQLLLLLLLLLWWIGYNILCHQKYLWHLTNEADVRGILDDILELAFSGCNFFWWLRSPKVQPKGAVVGAKQLNCTAPRLFGSNNSGYKSPGAHYCG
jgi:hypothetical protein